MRKALENHIPPPVVMGVIAVFMYGAKQYWSLPLAQGYWLIVALGLCVIGVSIDLISLGSFFRAGTTPSPIHIERAEKLVRHGLYRYTRNPMYVGMFITLIGLAVLFSNGLLLLGPLLFVLFIERFQILPEERFLREKFGPEFEAYVKAVPRWI